MKDSLSLMSPKREYMHILFLIIFLTVLESRNQYCRSKNGRKICCSGFWYEKKNNQCLKCPDGYYGQNCSDLCPFPYFGELCKHICNCSSALCHRVRGCFPERSAENTLCRGIDGVTCCRNYWYNEESHECVECNPGYIGNDCMEKCPFPLYGAHCNGNCNCSEEDCNHATGCSIPNIESKECNLGYFGTNSMEMCPFPSYGWLCSQSCNSSVKDCNHAKGYDGQYQHLKCTLTCTFCTDSAHFVLLPFVCTCTKCQKDKCQKVDV